MIELSISNSYKKAIVDEETASLLRAFEIKTLSIDRSSRITGYSSIFNRNFKLSRLVLLVFKPWILVDHINLNQLDNRKCNLRESSPSLNSANRLKFKKGKYSSKFKGVSLEKRNHKWKSRIGFNDKDLTIGTFKTQYEAALAYNKKAIELFGEHARLNNLDSVVL